MVPCRINLNLPLFGLGPSSKGPRSNLWLLVNKIVLFDWTLDPHLKWPLIPRYEFHKLLCTYMIKLFLKYSQLKILTLHLNETWD
jgi:hypothetical protein